MYHVESEEASRQLPILVNIVIQKSVTKQRDVMQNNRSGARFFTQVWKSALASAYNDFDSFSQEAASGLSTSDFEKDDNDSIAHWKQ